MGKRNIEGWLVVRSGGVAAATIGWVAVEALLVGFLFNEIVFDIRELGLQLGRVRFMYAPRACNQTAHLVASFVSRMLV
ncbi:hypothetical protein GBA52_018316 [Prunus armeniaca]|nr:hypothetical protein GBA52_018316 [Prunus armeniaca]